MKNIRTQIIEAIGDRINQISTANGYLTDWQRCRYWQSQPTEYQENYLLYSDGEETYSRVNRQHEASLSVEFSAVIFGEDAANKGTLALADLIRAIGVDSTWGGLAKDCQLVRSSKFCQTQGGTVCEVQLEILICYRFALFDLGA